MKRFAVQFLRSLVVSAVLLVVCSSAFARHQFDARLSWLTAWKANLGTEGWIEAVQGTVDEGMSPDEITSLLGEASGNWNPEAFTGIFEAFQGYDRVWFYETPYPVEATIRSDGGENVEMKGAWLAFQSGKLAYCSSQAPRRES